MDEVQQLGDSRPPFARAQTQVTHPFGDDRRRLHPRVERVERVLEDDLRLLSKIP